MKTLLAAAALLGAALPVRAHHESAFGLFWKNGLPPKGDAARAPEAIWRYAFVSRFRW
jgi:hypothetical protein